MFYECLKTNRGNSKYADVRTLYSLIKSHFCKGYVLTTGEYCFKITNVARIFQLLNFFSFISDQILVILRNRDIKSRPQYYSPE